MVVALLGAGSAPALAATARVGGAVVQASPSTGLVNQQTVWVTGSGFAPGAAGLVVECNLDPGQPTVTFGTTTLPVGCTALGAGAFTVGPDGTVNLRYFRVSTGNLGALLTGPDSSGRSAASDAASYPCPPTPAQQAVNISCGITVSDATGTVVTVPVSLIGPGAPATGGYYFPPPVYQTATLPVTGTPAPTPSPSPAPIPSATAAPGATSANQSVVAVIGPPGAKSSSLPFTSSTSSLAFTGAGRGLWLIGGGGAVLLFLGYLFLTVYRRPRQLLADGGRSVARAFGAGPTPR